MWPNLLSVDNILINFEATNKLQLCYECYQKFWSNQPVTTLLWVTRSDDMRMVFRWKMILQTRRVQSHGSRWRVCVVRTIGLGFVRASLSRLWWCPLRGCGTRTNLWRNAKDMCLLLSSLQRMRLSCSQNASATNSMRTCSLVMPKRQVSTIIRQSLNCEVPKHIEPPLVWGAGRLHPGSVWRNMADALQLILKMDDRHDVRSKHQRYICLCQSKTKRRPLWHPVSLPLSVQLSTLPIATNLLPSHQCSLALMVPLGPPHKVWIPERTFLTTSLPLSLPLSRPLFISLFWLNCHYPLHCLFHYFDCTGDRNNYGLGNDIVKWYCLRGRGLREGKGLIIDVNKRNGWAGGWRVGSRTYTLANGDGSKRVVHAGGDSADGVELYWKDGTRESHTSPNDDGRPKSYNIWKCCAKVDAKAEDIFRLMCDHKTMPSWNDDARPIGFWKRSIRRRMWCSVSRVSRQCLGWWVREILSSWDVDPRVHRIILSFLIREPIISRHLMMVPSSEDGVDQGALWFDVLHPINPGCVGSWTRTCVDGYCDPLSIRHCQVCSSIGSRISAPHYPNLKPSLNHPKK